MHRPSVAIHQPNYLPWTGYFLKMSVSDIFVFHDNVKLSKSSPTRRVQIHHDDPDIRRWLTVPLQKHSDYVLIKDLKILNVSNWRKKHLAFIRASYHGAPCFDEIFALLEQWLNEFSYVESLAKLNVYLIKNIAALGKIDPVCHSSSELPVEGKGSAYNLNIVKHLKGRTYISGKGGEKYQDKQDFSSEGIHLVYADTMSFYSTYLMNQNLNSVRPSYSIIDFLMYSGKSGFEELIKAYKSYSDSTEALK